ncbi:type I polyketide synthase [Nocardioides sp. GXZ039]|uniref:type I polyketide synthase n=1 Tax=Nocardioides sp. GXZ039 TaxID=3136018 RepID=UPI0030F376E5
MTALQDPVAVVGIACRLPGADGPDELWRLLDAGTAAITDAPTDRWPTSAGATTPRWRGGFIDSPAGFDAELFGIEADEAAAMDPQHRLAMELAWHALEDARTTTERLRGRPVGVFTAGIGQEYPTLVDRLLAAVPGQSPYSQPPYSQHTYTGLQRSMMANRLSYVLGLRGPSLTVDSGQSSALVAVHLACESLRSGESELAIVAGVNLMLLDETTRAISEFGALSPDGHCHVLDARANGYVRGEGGVALVLKPLDQALTDGDPVRCVIRGSAVNNDGGGAALTSPTVEAQRAVILRALDHAGLGPDDVDYVELHGTGTRVGDPVEAAALGAAIGRLRTGSALAVGSVKTNVGHLEGAAGLVGLLKAGLCLEHGALVASVGYEQPHPDIQLEAAGIRVVTATERWDSPGRHAGVSSFGMGGTNAHVVLGAAPAPAPPPEPTAPFPPSVPWVVSAAGGAALRAQAARVLEPGTRDPDGVAQALLRTRILLPYRAVCLGDRASALAAVAAGGAHPDAIVGQARAGTTALVFPGQGSQWDGMATELLDTCPPFRHRVEECAQALDGLVDFSVLDVLSQTDYAASLDRVDVVQPVLWTMLVALAEVWRAAGLRPAVVLGHSQGEIAAATAAGALSLADGARVVALRSRALARIAGTGGMLSVQAGEQVVEAAIADHAPGATIAALNSPSACVVSGSAAELAELQGQLTVAGYRARLVEVNYPSHSAAVEPLRAEILDALAEIRPRPAEVTVVSSVTGTVIDPTTMNADYWFEGLRRPVRFGAAVRAAALTGARLFVEASPHPVVCPAIEETIQDAGVDAVAVPTLRRGQGGPVQLERARAHAFVSGAPISWPTATAPPLRTLPSLPPYPLQRVRHWVGERSADVQSAAAVRPRTSADWLDLVLSTVGAVLDRPLSPEQASEAFRDLGVDSAGALEIRNRLQMTCGLALPAGLLFERPSPGLLAEHLHLGHTPGGPVAAPPDTVATAETRAGISQSGSGTTEPIAVVGMACRFPGGVDSPEDLWRLVDTGGDAVGEFPLDRGWDLESLFSQEASAEGRSATRFGGFLRDVAAFDAPFFGISPREAMAMDPQQRLLLTVAWEALERGGIDPAGLRGTPTGVFAGAMAQAYGPRMHEPAGDSGGHLLTGSALSVVSGRLAYTLGLEGPALTVDTACSSSLVSLHLAVQSLRRGECSLALAGGVTVMTTPGMFIEFSRQSGLSVDGRCKAFSADADGTGWSEGAGVVVLMRLTDAVRAGREVLAVIRGSAVNQDGRSNGLTAPNGAAQERVIRQALADAGLDAEDVSAVEAHGTGTSLGDPIEAEAVRRTYGAAHDPGNPVWLGSLKSNLGHTQAAAGVGSLIKMVEALRHGTLPRTLHAEIPSPHIDWSDGTVRLLDSPVPLDAEAPGPSRVGISGFGISGTNAHLVLEQAPTSPDGATDAAPDSFTGSEAIQPVAAAEDAPTVWVFSARSAAGLIDYALRLREHAVTADLTVTSRTLARRSRLEHRVVVVAHDRTDLLEALDAVAEGRPHPAVIAGTALAEVQPVLLFPGQGTQWVGMARDLLDQSQVFWDAMCEVDGTLGSHIDWSVLDVVRDEAGAPALDTAEVIQPTLFAVMYSLAALWRSVGVAPAAVIGHSQGEIAAACVAGAVSLTDAARLVVRRSRVLGGLAGVGGMVTVPLTADEATELISPWSDRLWVAIHSSPHDSVVGGDLEALDALERAHGDRLPLRRVAIGYAAHTPHIDRVEDDIRAAVAEVTPQAASVPIVSSVTGTAIDPLDLGPEYWWRGLREPVLFTEAVASASATVARPLFIEASPHPALTAHAEETLHVLGRSGSAVASLRRGAGGWKQFVRSVAAAFTAGAPVDWTQVSGTGPSSCAVPTYPFQNGHYWLPATDPGLRLRGVDEVDHPLFGALLARGDGGRTLTARLSAATPGWLADHVVAGVTLVPGAAFVEMAVAAAHDSGCTEIGDLVVLEPLVLPAEGGVQVQVTVGEPDDDGRRDLTLFARDEGDPRRPWTRHVVGSCEPVTAEQGSLGTDATDPSGAEIPLDTLHDDLRLLGYDYGPAFRGLLRAWHTDDGYVADVVVDDATGSTGGYTLHPGLLDAVLHPLVLESATADELVVPFEWRGVRAFQSGHAAARARVTRLGPDRIGIELFDAAGAPVASVDELVLRRVSRAVLGSAAGAEDAPAPDPELHALTWADGPDAASDLTGAEWALVGDADHLAQSLAATAVRLRQFYDLASVADQSPDGMPELVVLAPPGTHPDDEDDDAGRARSACMHALEAIQAWLADERFAESRLVVVTTTTDASWGLVRSAQAEHPGRFVLACLDDEFSGWADLAQAVATGEDQLLGSGDGVRVARLQPLTPASVSDGQVDAVTTSDPDPSAGLDPGRTVVITGGTGGLGALVAEHLVVRHGARHLLLLSRTGNRAEGAGPLVARLEELGADVVVRAVDVTHRRGLAAALADVDPAHPIGVVVHAAGEHRDSPVDRLTVEDLEAALAAKLDGAVHLHELTRDLDLEAFVLFSSVAGAVGTAGQANYAAANAALDALSRRRVSQGLVSTSIAWGLWEVPASMAGSLEPADLARLARRGIGSLAPEQALALLDECLRLRPTEAVAAAWSHAAAPVASVLRDVVAVPGGRAAPPGTTSRRDQTRPVRLPSAAPVTTTSASSAGASAGTSAGAAPLATILAGLSRDEAEAEVLALVQREVSAVLGYNDPSLVSAEQEFVDLGLDSLTVVDLRNRLTAVTGLRLPATLAFDHPTVLALRDHLVGSLVPEASAPRLELGEALEAAARLAAADPTVLEEVRALLQDSLRNLGTSPDAAARTSAIEAASDSELFEFLDNR